MIPVAQTPDRAVIVHPITRNDNPNPQAALDEAVGLTLALELEVAHAVTVNVRKIVPATFLGGGMIAELGQKMHELDAKVLVFDDELTPVQQRNLEERLSVKVLDRTGLILEIFSMRAQTKEGRLQVELARITYERSRLVRTWTHLERQRGGKGFLAGPGERQIESDRRGLSEKAVGLKKQLEKVRRTRKLHRQARVKRHVPMVALVGYTNAGKSTLFNLLTKADVFVKDMLFATLDPTIRELQLSGNNQAVLSDTVGFISALPTELIAAFRATLEEVTQADLVVHVRDIANPQAQQQKRDVETVLQQLWQDDEPEPVLLEVWNKTDLLDAEALQYYRKQAGKMTVPPVLLSSKTGKGVEQLRQQITSLLHVGHTTITMQIPASNSAALGWLYQHAQVLDCNANEDETLHCKVMLDPATKGRFEAVFPELAG
ncbi:Ribosome LSU-associated GTP-binding protein HflX [hydrothermal vent metagenome]|uniref:Ribosome LSU-associated GTP-binding protein HflX n=1 Tax=hydrothermal vent metagenome TaxID=652676 RepID=A0A3B0T6M7_9ZZZZ